jgi:hypothetical protein
LTPSVLNTSVKALSRFDPEERDCYLNSEFQFQHLQFDHGFRSVEQHKKIKFLMYLPSLRSFISYIFY